MQNKTTTTMMMMMDLFRSVFCNGRKIITAPTSTSTSTTKAITIVSTTTSLSLLLLFGVALKQKINWQKMIFTLIFGYIVPTKERLWPSSDDVHIISPESRGIAWILNFFQSSTIRRMLIQNNNNNPSNKIQIEQIPIPHPNSQSLLIYPTDTTNDNDNENNSCCCLIYLHGGGMMISAAGTTTTQRPDTTELGLAIELSQRMQIHVLSIDYNRLPWCADENNNNTNTITIEDSVNDIVVAYKWLLQTHPNLTTKLSFVGGSVGATLALLATIQLKEEFGLVNYDKLPTSLILCSPSLGLEYFLNTNSSDEKQKHQQQQHHHHHHQDDDDDGPSTTIMIPGIQTPEKWKSFQTNANVDGIMGTSKDGKKFYKYITSIVYGMSENQKYFQQQFGGNNDKLQMLPRCFITAGSYEVLLDGIQNMVDVLRKQNNGGGPTFVEYKVYEKMQHCHYLFFEYTKEANDTLTDIISWIQDSWEE